VGYFVGSPQVIAYEPDIPLNGALQNDAAIPREQLDVNVQFGRSSYGGHCTSRLAAWTVLFNHCLQDKHSRNIVGIPIAATEYMFKLLRLG